MRPSLSVIIVTWNSHEQLTRTLPALIPQLGESDELILVDNGSDDGTLDAVAELAPDSPSSRTAATSALPRQSTRAPRSRRETSSSYSTRMRPRRPAGLRPCAAPGWSAADGQPGSRSSLTTEASGSTRRAIRSISPGLSGPAATAGPIEAAPPAGEVSALSGACLAVPRSVWFDAGGFPERFFCYHEDVDLSTATASLGRRRRHRADGRRRPRLRVRLAAAQVATARAEPLGVPDRVYPAALLLLVLPALLATELALLPASIAAGWGGQKAAGTRRRGPLAAAAAGGAPRGAGVSANRRRRVPPPPT